ncbi:hypothetical protein CORC01_12976 [Colletotrichum orchidophilum]|uniref:Uncharacterized protein n=1 Tax=Colletotrichum orchidophilum TaxID=1209926 RepID=A0A1G4ARG1_9PEZI|nr:uncharacterized protein CORC01_12976 [Colletotrichum orchidophilum]OHE91749.1 hypothetical protein CORC01_12976 [Colletotrichum orchidophilum]
MQPYSRPGRGGNVTPPSVREASPVRQQAPLQRRANTSCESTGEWKQPKPLEERPEKSASSGDKVQDCIEYKPLPRPPAKSSIATTGCTKSAPNDTAKQQPLGDFRPVETSILGNGIAQGDSFIHKETHQTDSQKSPPSGIRETHEQRAPTQHQFSSIGNHPFHFSPVAGQRLDRELTSVANTRPICSQPEEQNQWSQLIVDHPFNGFPSDADMEAAETLVQMASGKHDHIPNFETGTRDCTKTNRPTKGLSVPGTKVLILSGPTVADKSDGLQGEAKSQCPQSARIFDLEKRVTSLENVVRELQGSTVRGTGNNGNYFLRPQSPPNSEQSFDTVSDASI